MPIPLAPDLDGDGVGADASRPAERPPPEDRGDLVEESVEDEGVQGSTGDRGAAPRFSS